MSFASTNSCSKSEPQAPSQADQIRIEHPALLLEEAAINPAALCVLLSQAQAPSCMLVLFAKRGELQTCSSTAQEPSSEQLSSARHG